MPYIPGYHHNRISVKAETDVVSSEGIVPEKGLALGDRHRDPVLCSHRHLRFDLKAI